MMPAPERWGKAMLFLKVSTTYFSASGSIEEIQYCLCLSCFYLDASEHLPFFWVLAEGESSFTFCSCVHVFCLLLVYWQKWRDTAFHMIWQIVAPFVFCCCFLVVVCFVAPFVTLKVCWSKFNEQIYNYLPINFSFQFNEM